jgi:hypothetical protein
MNNLQIICDIISKFVSGELYTSDTYKSCGFTPFNWYFIEKSERLYKIFEYSSKVVLPTFIEDFINNKLPPDFEYDYFQQNKDEVINFRSICFNIYEAITLIDLIHKCKSQIFINSESELLQKTFNHLVSKSSKQIIKEILNKENSEKINSIFNFEDTNIYYLSYILFHLNNVIKELNKTNDKFINDIFLKSKYGMKKLKILNWKIVQSHI